MTTHDSTHLRALLQTLQETLDAEYTAILNRDLDELERLAAMKSTLVDDINHAAVAREASVDAPRDDDIARMLQQCQRTNRINGAAIDTCQVLTTKLLDLLRGRSPGERVYTARGRLGTHQDSKPLMRI